MPLTTATPRPDLPAIANHFWRETHYAGGQVWQLCADLDGRCAGQLLRDGAAWVVHVVGERSQPPIDDLWQAAYVLLALLADKAKKVAADLERAARGFSGCQRRGWTFDLAERLRSGGKI